MLSEHASRATRRSAAVLRGLSPGTSSPHSSRGRTLRRQPGDGHRTSVTQTPRQLPSNEHNGCTSCTSSTLSTTPEQGTQVCASETPSSPCICI